MKISLERLLVELQEWTTEPKIDFKVARGTCNSMSRFYSVMLREEMRRNIMTAMQTYSVRMNTEMG